MGRDTLLKKRLVVNADDFGFTSDVNAGIVKAHREGILGAATLMANGAAFENAVALAKETPSLDLGCHLVLVSGNSVVAPARQLPCSVPELMRAILFQGLRPYEELSAQVRKIVAAGIEPTHLDTHKHTHLFPAVLDAVARIAREYGIRWVRRPFDFPMHGSPVGIPFAKRATSRSLGFLRGRFHTVLERHGCLTTDYFAGFQITGRFRTAELVALIENLPEGTTELMCHPGICGPELLAARTRLKQSREQELQALVACETKAALSRAGVKLVTYRDALGTTG